MGNPEPEVEAAKAVTSPPIQELVKSQGKIYTRAVGLAIRSLDAKSGGALTPPGTIAMVEAVTEAVVYAMIPHIAHCLQRMEDRRRGEAITGVTFK
jgi:hypothetical protein